MKERSSPGGTEWQGFRDAFAAFMALPFPSRPAVQELSDWGSSLLAVDGYIAGYAIRVESGSLDPREISDIDPLVLEVESLRRSLEDIRPQTREYIAPLEEFRCYIVALEALIHALALLADESGESTMG